MLVALISNHKIGNTVQVRALVIRINNWLRSSDLPGLPIELVGGTAVRELKDVDSILRTLESMSQLPETKDEEYEAIKSLHAQYAQRYNPSTESR